MSIGFINKKPKLQEKEITITENGTQTVTPDTGKDGLSSVEITTNVSGGGSVVENDVNFYDYDGTLVDSYSAEDFLQLSAMPENPSHTGLVAQGWNWDLADAKDYVEDYGILDVGQVYTTASGLSEFDIELTTATGLSVTLMMNGTKNWGDGTTDTSTSHTYSTVGKYTITCDGTTINPISGYNICNINGAGGQKVYYIINIRITGVNTIPMAAFTGLISLNSVTVSNDTETIGNTLFYSTYIKHFTFPKNITLFNAQMFQSCAKLKSVCVPKNAKLRGSSTDQNYFNGCSRLKRIILPSTYTFSYLGESSFAYCYDLTFFNFPTNLVGIQQRAFQHCFFIERYNFTKCTSVPTLANTNAFLNINQALTKIVVPDDLYENWISATNWSTYANYIVKESDYNA